MGPGGQKSEQDAGDNSSVDIFALSNPPSSISTNQDYFQMLIDDLYQKMQKRETAGEPGLADAGGNIGF